jgi:cytosine/adenosine deaminase-related metal-dependent hydrolase
LASLRRWLRDWRGRIEPMTTRLVSADWILEGFTADDEPILHRDAAVVVEDGMVTGIGPAARLKAEHPEAEMLGGEGRVVIPGLINAHHHVGLTPLQLGSPDHPLELWFASRLALRDVDLRLDTLFSAFEMIASGVTTVQHLHSRAPGTPEAVVAAGQTVMNAYREIGMRASYSMALRDQNRLVYQDDALFTASLPESLRPEMEAYFKRFTIPLSDQIDIFEALMASAKDDPRIKVQVAPANLHWLSDTALDVAGQLSEKHAVPMHMHVVETPYQKVYAQRRTGGSALAHLVRMGLAGPRLTIGHGVWMSEADIDLCGETGTHICHNCSSNFRLKSGIAPVNRFLARKVPVAIGIDEAGINDDRDMLQEMRMVLRTHREPGIDAPFPSAAQVLRMATEHGAATTPFGSSIGRLSPGCAADLVVMDWKAMTHPYQDSALPVVDVLVQRAKAGAIRSVMIAGETVYADGRFTRLDRDEVLDEIAALLRQPLSEAERQRKELSRAVFPHVRAFYDGWLEGDESAPHTRYNSRG